MVKHIETFPEQQLRKAKEKIEGYKPDRKFINGIEQPANQKSNIAAQDRATQGCDPSGAARLKAGWQRD